MLTCIYELFVCESIIVSLPVPVRMFVNMFSEICCHFWGAEGAPILFSDLGLRMASCSYV